MKTRELSPSPWNAKLAVKKQPKQVQLDKDFAGIKAGSMLYVATPQIIDAWVRKIPRGETRTIVGMRSDLACTNQCDATCPVSTAIFLRISAEAAIEQMNQGKTRDEVAPFWRVIEPGSTIGKKLSMDSQQLAWLRDSERVS